MCNKCVTSHEELFSVLTITISSILSVTVHTFLKININNKINKLVKINKK